MSGTAVTHYLNGASNGGSTINTTIGDASRNTKIGSRDDLGTMFKGSMDEVRISNIARSSGWITTEYNNQSSPGTFYSLGVEVSNTSGAPVPSPLLESTLAHDGPDYPGHRSHGDQHPRQPTLRRRDRQTVRPPDDQREHPFRDESFADAAIRARSPMPTI